MVRSHDEMRDALKSWVLPHRDGRAMLPPLLETHAPLDWVVILLGTNDVAPSYALPAQRIAFGCATLIWIVQKSFAGPGGAAPQVLLVAPHPMATVRGMMALFFAGGEETSKQLASNYEVIATSCGAHFLDAGKFVTASEADGVHLDAAGQRKLGAAVAEKIKPR